MGKALDLTNQNFGRLIALYKAPSKNKKSYWHCKCQCGEEKDIRTDQLVSGKIRSCGCLKKELDIQKAILAGVNNGINLIDQTFGYLQPIEKTTKRNRGHIVWRCKCLNCGSDNYEISSLYLKRGDTISCGCINRSNGEEKIYSLLKENNIKFEEQKTFKNCLYPDTRRPARFDFYIDNRYLLEFDGSQHYDVNNPWYREGKDTFKNEWCKENNIPLIRIPYTFLKKICLEDLLLETSSFIVKG